MSYHTPHHHSTYPHAGGIHSSSPSWNNYSSWTSAPNFDLDFIWKGLTTTTIPMETRQYLSDVFYHLFEAVGLATAAVVFSLYTNANTIHKYNWVFMVFNFIAFVWLIAFSSPQQRFMGLDLSLQRVLLGVVGLTTGFSTTTIVAIAAEVDPLLPLIALASSTVLFLALCRFSLQYEYGYLIGLYSGVATALSMVGLFSLMTMLFSVQLIPSFLFTIIGVGMFLLHIMMDVSYIAQQHRNNPESCSEYQHAGMLFVHFAKMFVYVLKLLMELSAKNNKNNNNNNGNRQRARRTEL